MNKDRLRAMRRIEEHLDRLQISYINNDVYLFNLPSDDLEIHVGIDVNDQGYILFYSFLPVNIKPEKIVEAAILINYINQRHTSGFFDLNIDDGTLFFKITSSYVGIDIDEKNFDLFIVATKLIVDYYNDLFDDYNNDIISFDEFRDYIREENL